MQRFIFYGGLAREGGKARVVRARGKNRGSYSIAWDRGPGGKCTATRYISSFFTPRSSLGGAGGRFPP